MNEFKTELNNLIAKHRERFMKRRQTIEARAAELNKGAVKSGWLRKEVIHTAPNWDRLDKPHAPFDGYLWEDIRTNDIQSYGKGEYLPYKDEYPKDEDIPNYPHNIIVPDELYTLFSTEYSEHIHVLKTGKCWAISGHGVRSVSLYKTKKSIIMLILKHSERIIKGYKFESDKGKGVAPVGKTIVNATIINVKNVVTYNGMVKKMLVELENKSTAYGTLPKGLSTDKGTEFKFQATFEHSKDSDKHSFFKNPTLK